MTERPAKKSLPQILGVVFDLDGTLVDAFADLVAAVNRTRGAYDFPKMTEEDIRRQIGWGTRNLVAKTVPVPQSEQAAAHTRFVASYDAHLTDNTRPYPGVEPVLSALTTLTAQPDQTVQLGPTAQIVRTIAVISNKPAMQTRRLLHYLGWSGYFNLVLGGDSLPLMKPHPEPVRSFLRLTGLPARRVVMVGDSTVDLQAGQGAGAHTVGVTYGNSDRKTLARLNPDFLIDRIEDLLPLLN